MISKFTPKRTEQLIPLSEIKEDLRLVDGYDDYYITPSGKIYKEYTKGYYYLRKNSKNKKNGYIYITLINNGRRTTHRLHRLVAIAYIPNPDNLPVVGHKNNDKSNCNVVNLYWTTNAENVQKAVNDGLLVNAKGYDDSQSYPVICYDENMDEISRFGSASECAKALHVSKSTVLRHCNHEIKTKARKGYYFRFQNI